jgi:hypothetical protein
MLEGIETPANISSQLHRCLKGEAIPVGDILELDIPLKYFFDGTIAHNLREVAKHYHLLIFHFQYKVDFFLHPLESKMLNNSFSFIFTKDFGGPFTLVKGVCLNDGQYFDSFFIGHNRKDVEEKTLQKNM